MQNKDWNLDSIISESDQAEVAKIANIAGEGVAARAESKVRRFLCRIGIHNNSFWSGVSRMAFQAVNEGSGETVRHDFELGMRCCYKCGRPSVRLRRI